jgi:hypothetical protein
MKIIFLDIDGVLSNHGIVKDCGAIFHPPAVEYLKKLITETDARLVISSTWKYAYKNLHKRFAENGLPFWLDTTRKSFGKKKMTREDEILQWVNWNEPENWIAIDDEYFEMKKIKELGKLVKTKFKTCFDEKAYQESLNILKV